MKKWIELSIAIAAVLTWIGFWEFHPAYADISLRQRITFYAIQAMGLFYGRKKIFTFKGEGW